MPGSTPPTSQLDWLISTTAMIVLSWSRATRDLLKSFGWGIRALHQLDAATMVPSPRRLPHTISPVEEGGFEPSVPHSRDAAFRNCTNLPLRALQLPRVRLDSLARGTEDSNPSSSAREPVYERAPQRQAKMPGFAGGGQGPRPEPPGFRAPG